MNAAPLRIGLVAPLGNMGRRLVELLQAPGAPRLAAAFVRAVDRVAPARELVADDVVVTADPDHFAGAIDVAIDFSAPSAAPQLAPALAARGIAYVVASTGLLPDAEAALAAAARRSPVLVAANTSLGIHALVQLVQQAAKLLPTADIEIVEAHHRRKRDAPSGTALLLGEAAAAGRAAGSLTPVMGRSRQSPPRAPGELGYSAVRGGDVTGEHTVWLLVDGERLELTHRCTDPTTFARGALAAGQWLQHKAPGRYAMADVLAHGG